MSVGMDNEGHFNALIRMFEQSLAAASKLPQEQREAFLPRLDEVRRISHHIGYGVGEALDELLVAHGPFA